MIGQMKKPPRGPNGEGIRRIQTQKPNARLAVALDIQTHVQLGERREPRKIWKRPAHDARHSKWHDADPRCPVIFLDVEAVGNERAEKCGGDWIMGEEEIVPTLPPRPGCRRNRPRSMIDTSQCRVHAIMIFVPTLSPRLCLGTLYPTGSCRSGLSVRDISKWDGSLTRPGRLRRAVPRHQS